MQISKEELQEYVEAKMSQKAISEVTGIPEPTVAWTMRRYGIESRLKARPKPSKEEIERLYHGEGLSIRGVAKRLGRSESGVQRWIRDYGIETKPKGSNQSGCPLTTDSFSERIAGFGHMLVSEYRGWNRRVRYVCRCGRNAQAFPSVLLRGGKCKKCTSELRGKESRLPTSIIEAEMQKNGDKYHSSYYIDGYLRVKYTCCNCGSEADSLWQNYRNGQKCRGCRVFRFKGENNPNWNPDLSDEERGVLGRHDEGYKKWAASVKKRDGFACQVCMKRGSGDLVSHHLYSYSDNKERRTDITNGVTMCEECHKEFHAAYGYGGNTKQQFEDFKSCKED